jgi:proline dehydrogenase
MMTEPDPNLDLNFDNTEIAFAHKSDRELIKTAWLFNLMNNSTLVNVGSKLGLFAVKFRMPFSEFAFKHTIFPQFCGGESLLDCQKTIDQLYDSDILTVLDYGAEGKSDEDDLDAVLEENLKAIEMAASNNSVPVISTKITGLVDHSILEKMHNKETLTDGEKRKYQHLYERVDEICGKAYELGISVFVDAEESWIQDPIDELVMQMSEKYNKERATVYNTYQLYLSSKLSHIKRDHERCRNNGVVFGCKMVRGAYMDKERLRAEEMEYPDPVQPDKAATDRDFNDGIRYCVEQYETISSCCASHNMESNLLQAQLIHDKGVEHNHPHINFCQLYGMSDNITYNLAHAGYNAAKYVVYGPIRDVVPYLIRRAQENASVTGDMSRELKFINNELKRRGLK